MYCQVFAKNSCTWKWAVLCSTRSGNLEAVRLQGHIHRIFSRGSSSKEEKGRQTQNMKTRLSWTILVWLTRFFYLKTQNGQVPRSPDWSISYYFLYKKAPFFSPQRGPPTSDILPNAFSIWNANFSLQDWLIPCVNWYIEYGRYHTCETKNMDMYFWSPLGSFRSGKWRKKNNTTCVLLPGICQAFVFMHLKVSSILQYQVRKSWSC